MNALTEKVRAPKGVIAGRALSVLALLICAMDVAIKLTMPRMVAEASAPLGWAADTTTNYTLAALLGGSALLYAIPRTAVLGAVLLTGYLGGAVATHVRVGSPLFSHMLFGVYLGIFVWAASICAIRESARCCR